MFPPLNALSHTHSAWYCNKIAFINNAVSRSSRLTNPFRSVAVALSLCWMAKCDQQRNTAKWPSHCPTYLDYKDSSV